MISPPCLIRDRVDLNVRTETTRVALFLSLCFFLSSFFIKIDSIGLSPRRRRRSTLGHRDDKYLPVKRERSKGLACHARHLRRECPRGLDNAPN